MLKAAVAVLKPYILALNPYWVGASFAITVLTGATMKAYRKKNIPTKCFTVLYLCLVYTSTVLSRTPGTETGTALRPFWSYAQWIRGNAVFLQFIILNILMLLPVGVSSCVFWADRKQIVGFGFVFSCLIEVSQLLTGRGLFEIDDIIHNTAGVVLGVLIYTAVGRLRHEYFSDWRKGDGGNCPGEQPEKHS